MRFTTNEERDLLATVNSQEVPFEISQNENIITYSFINYETREVLSFSAIYNNGQLNYAFDEELLHQVESWMKSENLSNMMKSYIEYKNA